MLFVLSPESALPCRCVKCNALAPGPRISRRISTLSAWYPLFSSGGWNPHDAEERPIQIAFSLCVRHRLQRLARQGLIGLAGLMNVMGFALFETNFKHDLLFNIAMMTPAAGLIIAAVTLRPILRPRRVHHGLAWFAGAGAEFLDSLPVLEEG
jgi:hypothetical protein